MNDLINSKEALDFNYVIQNWTYKMQAYSVKISLITYFVDNSTNFEIKENKPYLTSPKGSVQIPDKFKNIIAYILKQETINERNLRNQFKDVSGDILRMS